LSTNIQKLKEFFRKKKFSIIFPNEKNPFLKKKKMILIPEKSQREILP